MNKPVSTIVIAIDVPTAGSAPAALLKGGFDRLLLAPCAATGVVTQEAGGLNLMLTLAPDAEVDAALRRVAAACLEFDTQCAPARVRALCHYGTVFRNEGSGGVTYLGSALRAAQTNLRRVQAAGGIFASRDFADFANNFKGGPVGFSVQATGGAPDEAKPLRFDERRRSGGGGELPGSDPAYLAFLKKRLAQDIGPFAGPLVDNTSHASMSAKQLASALSHEIDKAEVRQRFEAEVVAYIKSRSRP